MKKLTLISLMICCLAAIGLTSCNNDVEYKGLTNEQKAEAFNTVKGSSRATSSTPLSTRATRPM